MSRYISMGFTIVDIILVAALAEAFAAVTIPIFDQAREKSRMSGCSSNMRRLGVAFMQYTQDYDETFPIGYRWDSKASLPMTWPREISAYVKSDQVFACPDDDSAGKLDPNPENSSLGILMSYSVNGDVKRDWLHGSRTLCGPSGVSQNGGAWDGDQSGKGALTQADITDPSNSILLHEKWSSDIIAAGARSHWNPPQGNFTAQWSHNNVTEQGDWSIPDPTLPLALFPKGRNQAVSVHNNGLSNFAFCDGHVKALNPVVTHKGGWSNNVSNMWDTTREGQK